MSIAKRIEKLEQQNIGCDEVIRFVIQRSQNTEDHRERILSEWEQETGRQRPKLVIFRVIIDSDEE